MNCSFKIKKEQFKKDQKVCNFVSDIDYDDAFIDRDNILGRFCVIITPLDCYKKGSKTNEIAPTYYYKETDDGYIIEGEGYIITDDFDEAIRRYNKETKKKWKGNPPI